MSSGPLAFAFVTGVVAAFNPCGFAMLPAYVTTFVGQSARRDEQRPADLAARIARAGVVAASVTVGFMIVFGAAGLAVEAAKAPISEALPYVTVAIGIGLAIVGILMVSGRNIVFSLPKLQRGGSDGTVTSMVLYGMSYATVSISCTLPLFLSVVATAFDDDFASGFTNYLAYAAGMGTVLSVLTLAVATAQQAVVRGMRRVLPHIARVSGVLLAIAGVYVAAYGWYEIELARSDDLPTGPVAQLVGSVTEFSAELQSAVSEVGSSLLVAALICALGAWATALVISRRAKRR